jgi:hypothetical protein
MIFVPNHLFNTNLVLTSGMGFDDYGEIHYTGSALVSGTGYLKSTDEFAVTNQGLQTVTRVEVFTSPAVMVPAVGDKLEVTSGPAISSGTTYRVTNVRAVVDVDGFHALNVSQLQEIEF